MPRAADAGDAYLSAVGQHRLMRAMRDLTAGTTVTRQSWSAIGKVWTMSAMPVNGLSRPAASFDFSAANSRLNPTTSIDPSRIVLAGISAGAGLAAAGAGDVPPAGDGLRGHLAGEEPGAAEDEESHRRSLAGSPPVRQGCSPWAEGGGSPEKPAPAPKPAPKPEAIRVDGDHLIYPLNTEYEIFTVGGKGRTLGAR